MFLFAQAATIALTTLAPNDARIRWSHYAGTLERDNSHARIIRPIDTADQGDPSGQKYSAPAARATIAITATAPSIFYVDLYFDGLLNRQDIYNARGTVLINGNPVASYDRAWTGSNVPVGFVTVSCSIPAGSHVVALVFPYAASMQLVAWRYPSQMTINAAPAVAPDPIILIGDSRLYGVGAADVTQTIAFRLAQSTGREVINLANAGRQQAPGDYTIAASLEPVNLIAGFDFNNFYPNTTTKAAFKALTSTAIGNALANSDDTDVMILTSFASTSDADWTGSPGPYIANNPTLEQFRQAEREAVAEAGSARVSVIEGRGPGMPTADLASSPDGVHYWGNTAQAMQAAALEQAIRR